MPRLESLSPPVRGLILDMDGVLWSDTTPLGDLPAIFSQFRKLHLQFVFATNNATKTVEEYLAKLSSFGVKLDPGQIVTSSHATAHYLEKTYPRRGLVFVVGENGILSALREAGFSATTDPDQTEAPRIVVGRIDRTVTYPKLRRAAHCLRSGGPFFCARPVDTLPA